MKAESATLSSLTCLGKGEAGCLLQTQYIIVQNAALLKHQKSASAWWRTPGQKHSSRPRQWWRPVHCPLSQWPQSSWQIWSSREHVSSNYHKMDKCKLSQLIPIWEEGEINCLNHWSHNSYYRFIAFRLKRLRLIAIWTVYYVSLALYNDIHGGNNNIL